MIKILVTGDFYPSRHLEEWVHQEDWDRIYSDFRQLLKGNDISITNLEAPLQDRETPIKKSGHMMRLPLKMVSALLGGEFSLVTLANNHIMDQGEEGLRSTIEACRDVGIDTVGVGMNSREARTPYFKQINGVTVAIINITENEFSTTNDDSPGANGVNPITNYYDIVEAKKKADCVIVIAHGGNEGREHPSPAIQDRYRFYIDIGADAVIAHHPHQIQGYEIYREAPIFYSLGNFIFPTVQNLRTDDWSYGYAVVLEIEAKGLKFELHPYKQGGEKAGVRLLSGEEEGLFQERIEKLNHVIVNRDALTREFDQFCREENNWYMSFFEPFGNKYARHLYSKGLLPSLTIRNRGFQIYDMIHCEAHREVVLNILKNRLSKKQ